MLKNNNLICNNIFKNKDSQERKQIFTKKLSELINQTENSIPVSIYQQDDHMYNKTQANRLVLIESLRKRGDKT